MKSHRIFGISVPERAWVPAPSYLLRRDRVRKMLRGLAPGRVLEIGCGAGALLHDLATEGFSCVGVESSPAAFELATYVNSDCPDVTIRECMSDGWTGQFDYVMAFEVLEHIEDDRGALAAWVSCLNDNGKLLLSVPAHPRRWSASDVWAGHFRRYKREGLVDLLEEVGLHIERFESYGFPLANMIEPVRALHHARQLRARQIAAYNEQRTVGNAQSGINRGLESRVYPLQASWIGTKLMQGFFLLQAMFAGTQWGTGYLILARRK